MLILADNSIDDLPPSICNLVHLKSLSLDNNKVKEVNASFAGWELEPSLLFTKVLLD